MRKTNPREDQELADLKWWREAFEPYGMKVTAWTFRVRATVLDASDRLMEVSPAMREALFRRLPTKSDQELVEACLAAVERICPPEYSVRTKQTEQAIAVIIPIVRQHYEQQIAKLEVMLEGNAAVAVIRQDEREKIARELYAQVLNSGWDTHSRISQLLRTFFRDRYQIEVGND